jgi:hypothetical protein
VAARRCALGFDWYTRRREAGCRKEGEIFKFEFGFAWLSGNGRDLCVCVSLVYVGFRLVISMHGLLVFRIVVRRRVARQVYA